MIGFAASPLIHQGIEISILIGLSRTEEMILAERTLLLLHLLDGMAHLLHTALGFAHLIRQLLIITWYWSFCNTWNLMFLKLLPFQGEGGKTPYSLILLYTAPGSGRLHSWR